MAAVATAVVAVAFVAGSSAATTERAAERSAPRSTFVSKQYGYELVLSGRYSARYAIVLWSGGFPFGHLPDVDMFYDAQDRKFIIAAKRLSARATLRSWQAAHVATKESFCEKSRAFGKSTLDGEPAREFLNRCPSYDVITLVAVHRSRGYMFSFVSPTENAAASDRRIYDAGRRSFRFTGK
jgi:hypothetical protein